MNYVSEQALDVIKLHAKVVQEGEKVLIYSSNSLSELLGSLFEEPHLLGNADLLYVDAGGISVCLLSSETLRSMANQGSFTQATKQTPYFNRSTETLHADSYPMIDLPEICQAS